MITSKQTNQDFLNRRLHSLDFFRGLTMFLLIAEFTYLFEHLTTDDVEGTIIYAIGQQFHHHPWSGLRFWDLIQPFFMFIVGVAIPFSVAGREKRGQSKTQIRNHVLVRSLLLLLFGWWLYCIGPGHIVFRFQNVLAQLSVTYLIAYLLMRKPFLTQLLVSIAFILFTEIIYRFFWVEGFNHPFAPNENFGTWLDLQYGGADLHGHWVSFNAIPTTAHTIWGVLVGQLLRSNKSDHKKLQYLVVAGIIGLIVGYGLHPITPIIKRICTSSFIFVSGGWTILAMAFSYWLIDIKHRTKGVWIFTIVGLNPLFIYLFAHVGGANLIAEIFAPFANSFFGWISAFFAEFLTSLITLVALWAICYWLFKKKIFIRI